MAKKKEDPIKLKGVTKKSNHRFTQNPKDPAYRAYQDSLSLYNVPYDLASNETNTYINSRKKELRKFYKETAEGNNVKYWENKKKERKGNAEWYDKQITKAKAEQKHFSDPKNIEKEISKYGQRRRQNFDLGEGHQLKHGKNKYESRYDYPDDGFFYTNIVSGDDFPSKYDNYDDYLDKFIDFRNEQLNIAKKKGSNNVSVSGMAATTRKGANAEITSAKILKDLPRSGIDPIGYTSGLESLSYPIYKKPTAPVTYIPPGKAKAPKHNLSIEQDKMPKRNITPKSFDSLNAMAGYKREGLSTGNKSATSWNAPYIEYKDPKTGERKQISADSKMWQQLQREGKSFKDGGKVMAKKNFANGGEVEPGFLSKLKGDVSSLGGSEGISEILMQMIGNNNPEVAQNISDYRTDPGKDILKGKESIAGGSIKGAIQGAATGGVAGLFTGLVSGMAATGMKNSAIEAEADQATQDWTKFWGGRSVQESASRSYASGGKIKGAGSGKSDSIDMKAPDGSFIVPSENSSQAMAYGSDYLGWDDGEVAKRNYGNVDINVSNGEVFFTPDEYETLSNYGVDVDGLAPNAEKNQTGFSRGGKMKKGYKNGSTVISDLNAQNDEALERDVNSPLNDYIANSMDAIQKEIQGESYDPTAKVKVPSGFGEKLKNEIGTIAGIAQAVGGVAGLAKAGRRPDINVSKSLERLSRDTRKAASYGLPPSVKNEMKKENAKAFRAATNQITAKGGSAQEIHNQTISALSRMLAEQGKTELADFQEKERKVGVNIGIEKAKAGQEFEIDKIGQRNWEEDQKVWANLLEVGIENTIGARQYNEQLKIMKEMEKSKQMSITFPKA